MLPSTINAPASWVNGNLSLDANNCIYVVQLKGSTYLPQNSGNAYCGKAIPGVVLNPSAPGPTPR